MRKILVIGCSGSGKTTFSKALSDKTKIPLYHLDKIYWKPNWVKTQNEEFREDINSILEKEEWIIDGNFSKTLEMRMKKADTIIFMDIRTDVCVRSVNKRFHENIGRVRDDMGSGCTEKIDDDFIDWIKTFRKEKKPLIIDLINKYPNLNVHIFKTRKEAYKYLEKLNN